MDTEKIETGIQAGDSTNLPHPVKDVLFVEVPADGFAPEQVQKFIRSGYACWGVVPLKSKAAQEGLVLLEELAPPAVPHLVLKLDVNAIPVNLLAFHLVKARDERGGINQLSETFFGMTIGALDRGLQDVREKVNGNR